MSTQDRRFPQYSKKTKNNRAMLCLISNNDSPLTPCRGRRSPRRTTKIGSKFFDMTDSRVFNLSPSDLLDRPFRDPATSGDISPTALRGLQTVQDVLVERLHGIQSNPVYGFMQPSNGVGLPLRSLRMGRPRQPAAPKSTIGTVFTANVETLLPMAYPSERNETQQIAALAKATGVGKETIRRALRGGAAPGIDVVDQIAHGLGVTAPDLLMPGFGIRHKNRLLEHEAQTASEAHPRQKPGGAR